MFNPSTFNLAARATELYPSPAPVAPMVDPPDVAAARAAVKAQQERAGQPGYAMSGQMYAQPAVGLPDSLKTGDRKIDNLTLTGLAQGVSYDQLAKNAGIALDYASRPMSEGGGKEPTPGLLDFILPAAMGLGVGAVAGPLTGAIAGGLFGQATAPLPLVGAGMAAVGAGAANALGSAYTNLTTGNGFTNTSNLFPGGGSNLALPGLQNAPGAVLPTAGVGPGALGYVNSAGQALTNIPGLNLANLPAITQPPAYTLGGLNPASLYNPQSLGGPAPELNSLGNVADALKVASQLSAAGGETPVGNPAPGVTGGIVGNYQSTTPFRQVAPLRTFREGQTPFLSGMLRT